MPSQIWSLSEVPKYSSAVLPSSGQYIVLNTSVSASKMADNWLQFRVLNYLGGKAFYGVVSLI